MNKIVNIDQRILSGKRIAICIEQFAPAHLGHLKTIIRAKREHDGALVIVYGTDGDAYKTNGLTLNNCFRSMRELFTDDEVVSVAVLDDQQFVEKKAVDYPAYMKEFIATSKKIIERNIHANGRGELELVWYVSEELAPYIKANFLGSEIVVVTNEVQEIGTETIINNPYKYWAFIMQPYRKYYSNNFLFFGTASTGKTNLVRDVARTLDAPYTDEYARRYEYMYNVRDEELGVADLHNMGVGQFNNNRDAITSAGNRGLMFADTDTMVTKCYSKQYLSSDEFQEVEKIFDYYIKKQKWALIFVIPPVTQYVDDGFRDMTHADYDFRMEMHQMFIDELTTHNLMDKVRYLNGTTFYERYVETLDYINEFLQEHYDSTILY